MTKTYIAMIAGAVAAACTDLSSPRPVAPAKPRASTSGLWQGPYATLDVEYVAIARAESTFGGLFLDSTQTPVVFLTDTTRLAAARLAGVDASLTSRGKSASSIRVRLAAYNFLQLKRWRDSASNVLATPTACTSASLIRPHVRPLRPNSANWEFRSTPSRSRPKAPLSGQTGT